MDLCKSVLIKGPGFLQSTGAGAWELKLCAFRLLVVDKERDYTLFLDVLSLLQRSCLLPWILLCLEKHITKLDLNRPLWVNISIGANAQLEAS